MKKAYLSLTTHTQDHPARETHPIHLIGLQHPQADRREGYDHIVLFIGPLLTIRSSKSVPPPLPARAQIPDQGPPAQASTPAHAGVKVSEERETLMREELLARYGKLEGDQTCYLSLDALPY